MNAITASAPCRSTTPRLPAWARTLLPMALFLPAALTSALPALIPGVRAAMQRQDSRSVAAYALVWGAPLVAYLVLAWLLVRVVDRRPFAALGLRPGLRALGALASGVTLSLMAVLAAALLAQAIGLGRMVDAATVEQAAPASIPLLPVLVLLLLRAFVLQGIGEEVLFRGYLLQSLSRRPRLAVLVCAVAFSIPHLASNGGQHGALEHLFYLAVPFGFALDAAMLAITLRSVWAAIGVHGGLHVATQVAVVLGLPIDGVGTWVLIGVAHAVVAGAISVALPRRRWAEVATRGPYARRAA